MPKQKLMNAAKSSLGNWIFEDYIFASKLPVNSSKCFQLIFCVVPLLRVQIYLTPGQQTPLTNCQQHKVIHTTNKNISFLGNGMITHWVMDLQPDPTIPFLWELKLIDKTMTNRPKFAITFIILDPSIRYLTRFPTISAGCTISSSIFSWTDVSVRVRGRWAADPFFGGRTILREAIRTTSCQTVTRIN